MLLMLCDPLGHYSITVGDMRVALRENNKAALGILIIILRVA